MGLGKTLTMISLLLKQRVKDKKMAAEAGSTSSGSTWLSSSQKGLLMCCYFTLYVACSQQLQLL